MALIHISKDPFGQIAVPFPHNPLLVAKAKTIPGHCRHPTEKSWRFQNTDKALERIPEIDTHVSTRNINRIRSPLDNLDLKKGGRNENNC